MCDDTCWAAWCTQVLPAPCVWMRLGVQAFDLIYSSIYTWASHMYTHVQYMPSPYSCLWSASHAQSQNIECSISMILGVLDHVSIIRQSIILVCTMFALSFYFAGGWKHVSSASVAAGHWDPIEISTYQKLNPSIRRPNQKLPVRSHDLRWNIPIFAARDIPNQHATIATLRPSTCYATTCKIVSFRHQSFVSIQGRTGQLFEFVTWAGQNQNVIRKTQVKQIWTPIH